jgi:hypothetical protein
VGAGIGSCERDIQANAGRRAWLPIAVFFLMLGSIGAAQRTNQSTVSVSVRCRLLGRPTREVKRERDQARAARRVGRDPRRAWSHWRPDGLCAEAHGADRRGFFFFLCFLLAIGSGIDVNEANWHETKSTRTETSTKKTCTTWTPGWIKIGNSNRTAGSIGQAGIVILRPTKTPTNTSDLQEPI